jgi:hypothetical protein
LRTAVELERDPRSPLAAFMTPVCKAFSTDAAVEAANLAIQVHGGYGYCREYRVEQILRDARITPIYEGTNGIQAMTLAGRLLHLGGGAAPEAFAADIGEQAGRAEPAFAQALRGGLGHWRRATEAVRASTDPGMIATGYLRLTGLVAFACGWSRLESAAAESPNPARTRAVAAFVREWMLPETAALADRIVDPPTPCADDIFADL